MRKLKIAGAISSIVITAFLLVLLISPTIRSQIMSISGLAVAQSNIQWNNVKDAAAGDHLTSGLPATALYTWEVATSTWVRVVLPPSGAFSVIVDTSGNAFYAIKRTDIGTVTSVNLPFGFTSKKVIVETPPTNTAEIVVDWIGGTAVVPAANTAGDDRIAAGRIVLLDNYAVSSLSIISVANSQTVYVRAFK